LLARGRARILLVSGVHQHTNERVLAELSKVTPDLFNCCVELGRAATDTVGNATETAAWVHRKSIKTLRLVTSAYHMPRSLVEFRRLLPHVRIIAHPVFTNSVKINDWWRWPGTTTFLAGEYNKYIISLVRDRFILVPSSNKES
ncbi:MAG: YdcF family protein, partial [Alphaproteobacteria bacterium]|nr:YdcF family protein [Alphaproteobacteria bacterium]